MRKVIIEFRESEENEDLFKIELYACQLTPEENKELRAELEKNFTVDFWYIDSDSFRCTIEEAQYSDLKRLEELGWAF